MRIRVRRPVVIEAPPVCGERTSEVPPEESREMGGVELPPPTPPGTATTTVTTATVSMVPADEVLANQLGGILLNARPEDASPEPGQKVWVEVTQVTSVERQRRPEPAVEEGDEDGMVVDE